MPFLSEFAPFIIEKIPSFFAKMGTIMGSGVGEGGVGEGGVGVGG